MIDESDVLSKSHELESLLEDRLGFKGRSLRDKMNRAGRRMPRRLRRPVETVAEAQEMGEHPKLLRMVDTETFYRAHAEAVGLLEVIDPVDRRRAAIMGVLGVIVFNLIVVVLLTVAVIKWLVTS